MSKFKSLADLLRRLAKLGIDPDDVAIDSDDIWHKGSDLEDDDDDDEDEN